jgi:hypothetical protein
MSLIQNKIFFGTLRRISDLTDLAVTSWAFSCLLNPDTVGDFKKYGIAPKPFLWQLLLPLRVQTIMAAINAILAKLL